MPMSFEETFLFLTDKEVSTLFFGISLIELQFMLHIMNLIRFFTCTYEFHRGVLNTSCNS